MRRQLSNQTALAILVGATLFCLFGIALAFSGHITAKGGVGTAPSTSPSLQQVAVTNPDGTIVQLPLVDGGNRKEPITGTAADADPRTHQVRGNAPAHTYGELDSQLGSDSKYIDCTNKMLGIDWTTDIPKFKKAEQDGYLTTFILKSNTDISDDRAREIAKRDDATITDKTPVLPADGIVNSRNINGECDPYFDGRPLVRPALGVLTFDKNGKPNGLLNDRGIFHGCHNPWYIPIKVTPPTSPSPSTTPTPGTSTPPGTPTTTPPPNSSTPPTAKDPNKDPARNGNAGNGGGKNEDPGPGTYVPPAQMTSPPSSPRENPSSPAAPTPSKPPTITPPVTQPTQLPTVAPSTQPPNHGTVPTSGSSGQPCNPDFQDC